MGQTPFSRRYAMPLCAVALLCAAQISFAQSPLENASLIGKWELISVDGSETTIPREKIEIEEERLRIRDVCKYTIYTYAINDGQITAEPSLTALVDCYEVTTREGEIARRNQDAIVTAVTHSTVQLSGDTLQLTPLPRRFSGELEFLWKLEFRREK